MVQILKYYEAKCLIYKGLLSPGDGGLLFERSSGGRLQAHAGMILFSTLSIPVST